MKPVVIIEGQKAKYRLRQNQTTVLFYFPKPTKDEGEKGEMTLVDGDTPRIIIKASPGIEIDRGQEEA
jgi:hypothetical protein